MIYALADLHLGSMVDKPMDVFGDNWNDYVNKITDNWIRVVADSDTVLVPGDISWAMSIDDAMADLEMIDALPGKKVLLSGNHDYWWQTAKKLSELPLHTIAFMKHGFILVEETPICGCRGWFCEGSKKNYTEQDTKQYARELLRLEAALKEVIFQGYRRGIVLATHFPPTYDKNVSTGFTELIERYGVDTVVYGHLHESKNLASAPLGMHRGVNYILAASNLVDFCPVKVV